MERQIDHELDLELKGDIVYDRISGSKTIRGFVERRVKRWLGLQGIAGVRELSYRVVFSREGAGHLVSCEVEIQSGARRWKGFRVANGLHQALLQCLRDMEPRLTRALSPAPA
jgi:hypothetical protein